MALSSLVSFADTQIQMEEYGGVYRIPCTVNGAKMKFIFDTGASNVCLSLQMAEYLLDNDFISKNDILGTGTSSVADGRIVDHVIINLKDIEISGMHLTDVKAVVIESQNAPLLLGQTAIQKLGSIEINGPLLTIKNDLPDNETIVNNLFEQASNAYDNKMYSIAMEKYGQLYSMGQLSDYGKYRYTWAALMAENPQKAFEIAKEITDFVYFEENKIDIYRLLGYVHQDLGKYYEAANYFELSSQKIQTEMSEWMKNFMYQGDCHRYMNHYSTAAEKYNYALAVHCKMHDIDTQYVQHDGKNKLKKNQPSFRNDDIDYILYYALFCMERSGEWSTDAFLMEAAAMARAGNKYATKMMNNAGIDPYNY